MPYKKMSLIAGVDDLIMLESGDYGVIECEASAKKVGGAFTKMFTTLTSVLNFNKFLPSGANEKDFILFTENCFFKIINFDRKDAALETDYDVIKFEFSPEQPATKFQYFDNITDTFVFVSSNDNIVSALKLESFQIPENPDFMLFKNGRNGSSVKLSKFDGNEARKSEIANIVNNGIEGKL